MKKQYVKFDLEQGGTYVQPATKQDILNAIDGDFDGIESGDISTGTKLTITVIEMEEEEYKNLPEFQGH